MISLKMKRTIPSTPNRGVKNAAIGCHEIHVYRFGSRVFARSENRRPVGVVVFMAMTIKARRLFVIQCVVVESEKSLRKSSGHNFGPKEGGTVNRSKMLQHGLSCSSLLERLARRKWLTPTAALTGTELVLFGLGRVDVVENS